MEAVRKIIIRNTGLCLPYVLTSQTSFSNSNSAEECEVSSTLLSDMGLDTASTNVSYVYTSRKGGAERRTVNTSVCQQISTKTILRKQITHLKSIFNRWYIGKQKAYI